MASEEERAIEYRRMMTARVFNKTAREKDLKPDPDYLRQIEANFALFLDDGWDPPPGLEDEK